MSEDFGAFVPGPRCMVAASASGALDGLRFAVKDLIDIAGVVTGGGNPDWAATHPRATRHAAAVERLLAAGASVCGKTITDELAFSLEGDNWHHGTPRNPRCPDCLPGGSSSGSAVAVAAGLAAFALGTDTGGSVRVPAAFCGVFGMRPSHGRVPLDGVLPFAPDYDTVGWFAGSAALLQRVGRVLLDTPTPTPDPEPRLLMVDDAFAITEPALAVHLSRAAAALAPAGRIDIFDDDPQAWLRCYQVLQGAQVRESLGAWIDANRPAFGPAIAPRFAGLAGITANDVREQLAIRETMRAKLSRILQPGVVLVLPTVPTTALPLTADADRRNAFYASALAMNAIAGHAGLPQLTIPAGSVGGKPAAMSFIAAAGADELLLRHASTWAQLCTSTLETP